MAGGGVFVCFSVLRTVWVESIIKYEIYTPQWTRPLACTPPRIHTNAITLQLQSISHGLLTRIFGLAERDGEGVAVEAAI